MACVLLMVLLVSIRADASLAFLKPLAAGDVTSQSLVMVPHGSQLTIEFGISNYGANNPGVSPYPTSLGFQVFGPALAGAPIAETSQSVAYFADYMLSGCLTSLDGTWSMPLYDPAAVGGGFAAGTVLLRPGTMNSAPVASGTASQVLDLTLSEALFGQNVSAYNSAFIVLQNEGADVEIGLGPGYTLRSAIYEPGVGGAGPIQTTGMTRTVTLGNAPASVPEPASWALLGLGLAGFAGRQLLARRR